MCLCAGSVCRHERDAVIKCSKNAYKMPKRGRITAAAIECLRARLCPSGMFDPSIVLPDLEPRNDAPLPVGTPPPPYCEDFTTLIRSTIQAGSRPVATDKEAAEAAAAAKAAGLDRLTVRRADVFEHNKKLYETGHPLVRMHASAGHLCGRHVAMTVATSNCSHSHRRTHRPKTTEAACGCGTAAVSCGVLLRNGPLPVVRACKRCCWRRRHLLQGAPLTVQPLHAHPFTGRDTTVRMDPCERARQTSGLLVPPTTTRSAPGIAHAHASTPAQSDSCISAVGVACRSACVAKPLRARRHTCAEATARTARRTYDMTPACTISGGHIRISLQLASRREALQVLESAGLTLRPRACMQTVTVMQRLLDLADIKITEPIEVIPDKAFTPSNGDKRYYVSLATYCWPANPEDLENPKGPWSCKDGAPFEGVWPPTRACVSRAPGVSRACATVGSGRSHRRSRARLTQRMAIAST